MFSHTIKLFFVLCFTLINHDAFAAQDDLNVLTLKSGYEITLPELPTDEVQLNNFLSLTEQEQKSFYIKRKFILQKLGSGLEKKGLSTAIRWSKSKAIKALETLKIKKKPEEQSSELTQQHIDLAILASAENMWENAPGIAKSNGVGMTIGLGFVWNTTIGSRGGIYARSISIDLGMNFSNNEGYLNIFYDKQSKLRGGLSLDIGPMLDVLLHITDPEVTRGQTIDGYQQKIPIMGGYRSGAKYNAWGAQVGVHVFEMMAAVATVFGQPEVGLTVIPAMRALGMMTIYRSTLERKSLAHFTLSSDNYILRKSPLKPLAKQISRKRNYQSRMCGKYLSL
jgi:hypothetical protein